MITRLPCARCGESIHPDTAAKNDGLCMPCKGGYRKSIEDGKRQREAERVYAQSPERKYWLALVDRVYHSKEGLGGLSSAERTYYAVTRLAGEVYNGGFDQFFSNSSGEMYGLALDGLLELEADISTGLLIRAKEILFGDKPVPVDRDARMKLMPTINDDNSPEGRQLGEVDKAFWADPEDLDKRCGAFAVKSGLYSDD